MSKKIPISIAYGDGIGPEIMEATLFVLKEGGASLDLHPVDIGEKVYLKGIPNGIEPSTWEMIKKTKAFLKAPITTPQGGGFKSLNVTIRTTLGLYANVRPCVAYFPYVETKHPGMDVVIVRENEEDLYMGLEYQLTENTFEAKKIMTRQGCERIIRYAFEYALAYQRKKVTCFVKDNILKETDGLFHKIFDQVGEEYSAIEKEHWIVDIGAAKLADTPTIFDVIVMPNLYGDILSDVAAQIAGSVGLAGSSNIGPSLAMFEAIHGSAPRRAGQNLANPSGLLLAAIQMLVHIGQPIEAARIHNAWLKTIEDGIHTYDIFKANNSKEKVGTQEFARAVVARLGQEPIQLPAVHYSARKQIHRDTKNASAEIASNKELLGADVFINWKGTIEDLVTKFSISTLKLNFISNRGVRVWPDNHPETLCSDCWRARLMSEKGPIEYATILKCLEELSNQQVEIVQVQSLYHFH